MGEAPLVTPFELERYAGDLLEFEDSPMLCRGYLKRAALTIRMNDAEIAELRSTIERLTLAAGEWRVSVADGARTVTPLGDTGLRSCAEHLTNVFDGAESCENADDDRPCRMRPLWVEALWCTPETRHLEARIKEQTK